MRLQGAVILATLSHNDCVQLSEVKRVRFTIAKAIERQLSSQVPRWRFSACYCSKLAENPNAAVADNAVYAVFVQI